MLESSRFWCVLAVGLLGGCALVVPEPEPLPAPAPVVVAPVAAAPAGPVVDHAAEEAKALLAQAETDVQRARSKRALWLKAWEDLVVARKAVAAKDHANASLHARRASEYAHLGLEQLAYPAVR